MLLHTAEALEERINQIVDPNTGETVGGVTKYNSSTNNFTFKTGTSGSDSTIKVKGTARLGLDDVPLGVGSVPQIYNLFKPRCTRCAFVCPRATNVETPPDNMVDGYYPLYIDEGELTFDKTGKLISPKNNVHTKSKKKVFQSRWMLILVHLRNYHSPSPFYQSSKMVLPLKI